MKLDLFPSKLASGKNFCDRVNERKLLKENIEYCRHTVLVSPRRYGKTSLIFQVIKEIGYPSASVDLFLANDEQTVTRRIINGVSEAVSSLLPKSHKVMAKVQEVFKFFKISLGYNTYKLEYSYVDNSLANNIDVIYEALNSLAKLAEKHEKIVVFYIDEFQDILSCNSNKLILGAIRNVAQSSKYLCFIFSGSNRHLLSSLFDDSSTPLYLLCEKIKLERILTVDYETHLNSLSIERWGDILPKQTFNQVMQLTEAHAFYVNMLCSQLWKRKNLPQPDEVLSSWEKCLENEERRIISELQALTPTQQDVLKGFALEVVTEPYSHKFSTTVRRPPASVRQSTQVLLERDLIFKVDIPDSGIINHTQGAFVLVDPLMKYKIRKLI